MKTITNYLLRFTLVTALLTGAFRYFLSYGIDNRSTVVIILVAVLYFICMFASGWYFGKKESEYLPIYDIGFRFHLTTYLIYNLISELWFFFGFNSGYESVGIVHSAAIVWGIFVLIHFMFFLYTGKKSINNIEKKGLFE